MDAEREKKQKAKKGATKARLCKIKADVWFLVYYEMGPERSLGLLCEHAAALGQRRAINTFKRWSSMYDWQQRLVEEDTRRHDHDLADADKRRTKMMSRQGQIGKTMQTLAVAGMPHLQDIMIEGRLNMEAKEIVGLAKAGTDLELRAAGEPTHKIEVTTVLYNVLIARIARIFKEANQLPTAEGRENLFATRIDQTCSSAMEEVHGLLEQGKG